jgi:hypothetical protein
VGIDVHGRYVIGLYLPPLLLLGVPWTWRQGWLRRPAAWIAAGGVLHLYCLRVILSRYF